MKEGGNLFYDPLNLPKKLSVLTRAADLSYLQRLKDPIERFELPESPLEEIS